VSCGNPHATPCTEVLEHVHQYVDGEVTEKQRIVIIEHLEECAPCVHQFEVVRTVKALVHRSCGSQSAPDGLRLEIVTRIRQVSMTYRVGDADE
jgi:mycothiol system anti-sigma-R factor